MRPHEALRAGVMAEELRDASPPSILNHPLGWRVCLHVVEVVVGERVRRPHRHTPATFVSEKVGEGRGGGRCMGALNLVMSSNRRKLEWL